MTVVEPPDDAPAVTISKARRSTGGGGIPATCIGGTSPSSRAQLSLLTTTKDVAEGIAAFFDKREPRWTGR